MVVIQRYFSPSSDTSGGTKAVKKAKTIKAIPDGDTDFLTTAKAVNAAWKLNTKIILIWIEQPEYEVVVGDYEKSLTGRQKTGSKRKGQTFSLKQVNVTIDEGVTEMKTYIEKKYKKKNAQPHFVRFGITKQGTTYKMVVDQDERAKALELMIDAVADDGFGSEEYGTAFWKDIQTKFNDAVAAAKGTDKSVSGSVSIKKESRKQAEKVMKSLRLVIEGNFPDTYKSVLRQWGFLKQR